MEKEFTSEAKKEVERLVRQGQKLQAIKYLMDTFGTTLAESKVLAEAVEREIAAEAGESLSNTLQGSALQGNLKGEVIQLLQAGKKLDAIKLVKQTNNTGLKEALKLVEELDKETNPNYRSVQVSSGCAGGASKVMAILFGLVAFLLLAVAGMIYYFQTETIKNSNQLTGVVIDFQTSEGSTAPIIAYHQHGQEKRYKSTVYSTPPAYVLKEEVPMFVNRDDPDDVILDTFTDRWLAIVVLGGFAAFLALFVALFLFIGRKF